MQRAIIIVLSLFAAVTIGVNDDFAERLSQSLSLTKSDVETCMNKTNVSVENIEKLDELMINNVRTPEIDESVAKIGCLFACLAQKIEVMSDARLNVNKIKELLDSKQTRSLDPKHLEERNRVLDTCAERVKSKINECEVAITFFLCLAEFVM